MKNILTSIMVFLIVMSLAGCKPADNADIADFDNNVSTESSETLPSQDATFENAKDENLPIEGAGDIIEITVPSFLLSDIDPVSFDADSYIQEQGLLDAKLNDDGSITIKMSQARYQSLRSDLENQVSDAFNEHRSNTDYVKEITSDSIYSQITVTVNKSGYESAFDITHVALGFPALLFQAYTGNDIHCEISIIDESGETLYQCVLPDAMNEW